MFDLLHPDPLWLSILLAAMAVVLIGIAKAGFGGAIGIVAVPLMAASMRTDLAVGVMLPVLIVADWFSLIHHRRHASKQHLRWLVYGMIIGLCVGTGLWAWLGASDHLVAILNFMIGGLCLLFVVYQFYRLARPQSLHVPTGRGFGMFAGAAAATVSTLAHSAGLVVSLYMLAQRLEKKHIVGTMVLFFTILNLAKLPTFIAFDLISRQTLLTSLWLLPFIPVGTVIGYWMHHRVAERPFVIIVYAGAIVAAVRMIYQGLMG